MPKELMSLKATNGTVIAYEDRVVISRKGFAAWATQGFKGDRTFFYSDLSGIEYKKPGMINGYMKFITAGTRDISPGVGLMGSSLKSVQDENTVILRAFNTKVPKSSEELYRLLMDKVQAAKSRTAPSFALESAPEQIMKYKELVDAGVITEEEFNLKKKQLLNL